MAHAPHSDTRSVAAGFSRRLIIVSKLFCFWSIQTGLERFKADCQPTTGTFARRAAGLLHSVVKKMSTTSQEGQGGELKERIKPEKQNKQVFWGGGGRGVRAGCLLTP